MLVFKHLLDQKLGADLPIPGTQQPMSAGSEF